MKKLTPENLSEDSVPPERVPLPAQTRGAHAIPA
jgi:hypothetical protein